MLLKTKEGRRLLIEVLCSKLQLKLKELTGRDWQIRPELDRQTIQFFCMLQPEGFGIATEAHYIPDITFNDVEQMAELDSQLVYRYCQARSLERPKSDLLSACAAVIEYARRVCRCPFCNGYAGFDADAPVFDGQGNILGHDEDCPWILIRSAVDTEMGINDHTRRKTGP